MRRNHQYSLLLGFHSGKYQIDLNVLINQNLFYALNALEQFSTLNNKISAPYKSQY